MGCDLSSEVDDIDPKVTPAVRNINEDKKQLVLPTIENDDLLSMATIMQQEKIFPHSEVSDSGMVWMLSHMCCRWDSPHCLEYLLKEYFAQNPKGYIDFVNAPTIEGYTCLHLCGIWNAHRCFSLLLQCGGLNLKALDKMRKTPLETSLDYKSGKISDVLKQFKALNLDFIQLNTQKLISGSLLTDEPKTEEQKKKDEERFEIKFDPNLYGVTGNLFDFTEEKNNIRKKQNEMQLQRQKLQQEKARKKEKERAKKEEMKKKKKEEEEQKKKQAALLMTQELLADYVDELQVSEDDDDEDKDQEDMEMTKTLRTKETQMKKIQKQFSQIQMRRNATFKFEENKKTQLIVTEQKTVLQTRIQQKNDFIKNNGAEILKRRNYAETRSKIKPSAENLVLGNSNSLPPEIQKLYESAKSSGKFVDKEFPATNSTIGDSSKSNFKKLTTNLVWLRPSQFFKGDYKLFDGIDPNDIKQGSLGVCYMLATISALAANPKNIEKLFVFHDLEIGFFVLHFYINGKPKHLVVDDLIPCSKHSKSPIFTKPIGNEIWVLLLEKAWAKAIGNYLSAEAMTPDHMMEDLSGAPGYGSWFKTEGSMTRQKKVEECVKHDQLGHIIVVTSVGDKKIQGIANNHAYSVLKIYMHEGNKIFKIRNPWGRFEWNGQYGENSTFWTPKLKEMVGFEKKDDGIFYLSESELLQAFCYYSISQIHSDFNYSFIEFTSGNREDIFFKFDLPKDTEINLRVTQPFKRMVKDSQYDHSPMVFEVGKIQSNEKVTFLSEGHQRTYWGAKSVHAFQDITKNLSKGSYIVRVRMLWKNSAKFNSGVIGIYANSPVEINKISPAEGIPLWKLMLLDFCESHSNRKSKSINYKVVTMKGQFVFPVYSDNDATITFKFDRQKMNLVDMGQNQINDHELQMLPKAGKPDVGTMVRTEPAKGGSTGQFFILGS